MFTFKKLARRASTATAFAVVGSLALSGVAVADDIVNKLDASVDAVAEIMPLNVGGVNGSTTLYLVTADGDGKNGCNLTGSTTLTLSVVSSNTSVATVTPGSVTFTSCGDTEPLTVAPGAAGSATVTVSQVSNSTAGSFNLAPATFIVNVTAPAPANTAPKLSVAGVDEAASYDKGSVPAATCQVTDAEDGPSSFPATVSAVAGPYAADGIGAQTASCSYTDKGTPALSVSASETYAIVDPSSPVIGYTLNPAAADGSNGWYQGNVTVTWHVSEPQSPSSLQKTGCVDQNITADQEATTYTCSATSAGGSAVERSVTIGRDGIAPAVSESIVSGTAGNNGWYTSDVAVQFTATDATSGLSASTPSPQTVTSSGQGSAVAVTGPEFTDNAGNAAAAVTRTFKIDKTTPLAPSASLSSPANGEGWHNGDVVVTFTSQGDGGAGGSGVAACTDPVSVNVETAGQTVSGTCTDQAGNVSAAKQVTVKLDKTGPVVADTTTVVAGTEGDNDWYTSDVTVEFTATDALSGLTPIEATKRVTSSGEGQSVTVNSPAFTDIAGNTTNAGALTPAPTFKIDKTAPATPTFSAGISDGDSFYFGSVPVEPTCQSTDALPGSGLASCTVGGYSTAVGPHTLTATATDHAGNRTTATRSYTVLAWTTKGFYAPVDMGGVWNTVKGGSTVPLKFELFAGSTELTSIDAVQSFTSQKISCTSGSSVEDPIEVVTTGGTSLRYDSTGGQFIQNWKTPTGAGACYSATMTADDGSFIRALFKIK